MFKRILSLSIAVVITASTNLGQQGPSVKIAYEKFTLTNGLDAIFHALAVVEVFVTLRWLLGDHSPTFTQAVAFEALNRVVTVVFKFVPFRVGVDEAISGAAAPLLAVDPAAAVALAVVRKVRNLFWSFVGLAVIVAHPAEAGRETHRREGADEPRL